METNGRHHMEFQCHGDDIETYDSGDGKVKVLAGHNGVQGHPALGIIGPIGDLALLWIQIDSIKFSSNYKWDVEVIIHWSSSCRRWCYVNNLVNLPVIIILFL